MKHFWPSIAALAAFILLVGVVASAHTKSAQKTEPYGLVSLRITVQDFSI